jgi:hypothetical protein
MADWVDTVETTERRPGGLNWRLITLLGITAAAAALHVAAPIPNFSPLYALALFGGAYFANRAIAICLPLAAMLLGDLVFSYLDYVGAGMGYGLMVLSLAPFVYGSFLITVLLGMWIRRRRHSLLAIVAGALGSSVLFFIISNFGFWVLAGPWTLAGLAQCYVAAIPFFRYTLASNALFTVVLFGGFAAAQRLVASLREPVPVATLPERPTP